MSTPDSLPKPAAPILDLHQKSRAAFSDRRKLIERLATEMRARSGGELPHSFYVEKVKQRLLADGDDRFRSADISAHEKPPEAPSVFHAWALRE
jgi:hypothetical protein